MSAITAALSFITIAIVLGNCLLAIDLLPSCEHPALPKLLCLFYQKLQTGVCTASELLLTTILENIQLNHGLSFK